MDESKIPIDSYYPSIDTSISSAQSPFNKEDEKNALRRMGRGLIRCPLKRSCNPHEAGGGFFQGLQHQDVTKMGVPGTEEVVQDKQTDKDVDLRRENSTDSSASSKRSKFRQSGEFWPTQAEVDLCDEGQDGPCEEASAHPSKTYSRQLSDTGSLPDVILSTSSATEASPDLVNLDDGIGNDSGSSESLEASTDLPSGAMLGKNCDSEATSAERKFEIEGLVNDPKVQKFHIFRQVSFNKQVSVREIDGGIDRIQSDKGMTDEDQDPNEEVFSGFQGEEYSSDTCTQTRKSAVEKRHKYSDRTSGYVTSDGSKNSQTGSSDCICNTSTEQTMSNDICYNQIPEPRRSALPVLSIFERDSSGTLSSGNQSVLTISAKPGTGSPNISSKSDTADCQAGLPILSILNDDGDSFVMPPLGQTSSRSCDDTLLNTMPPEVELCLATSGSESIGYRSTDFDKYALETLCQFQRSNSTPPKRLLTSAQSTCISPNGHRNLTKALTFPMQSKAMREELINNYSEDLLYKISYLSPATEYESVIQKIRAATTGYSDSSSPSPLTPLTPKTQQGYVGTSPTIPVFHLRQNQKKFSFQNMQSLVLCSEGKSIQDKMLQASRCRTNQCQVQDCKMGKEILSRLDDSMTTAISDVTYANHNLPLIALLDHSLTCDEMKCSMPWCSFLNWRLNRNSPQDAEDINPRQVVKVLTQFAQLPTLRFTSCEGREETLFKLNSQFPYKTVTEGIDWIPMVRMGTFGGSIMATATTTLNHWIIKKVHLTHSEEDSRLEVYRRLRDHGSPNIVSYLWMKQSRKLLHVCYVCEQGKSLHEHLQSCGPLNPELTLYYFRQILEAAIFLHKCKILYLYWTAKNILLGTNGSKATCKLCNFTAAVCLNVNYDIEDVACMVPATLLPIELISGDDLLCIEADSWGLGCLLTELLTARPARQDLIHEERCAILKKLELDPMPKKPDVNNDIVDQILNNCWKINPQERMPATGLKVLTNSSSYSLATL